MFDDFDTQVQCEELPGFEEWWAETQESLGYYEQEDPEA